jgi:hypothetical protein
LTIRNSRTYADWLPTSGSWLRAMPEVRSLKPEVFPRQFPCNTACPPPLSRASARHMLWSEKTTVCRIFSCQRSVVVGLRPTCAAVFAAPSSRGPRGPRFGPLFAASLPRRATVYVGSIGTAARAALSLSPTSVCVRSLPPPKLPNPD